MTVLVSALLSGLIGPVRAQESANWWDGIPGFGSPNYGDKPRSERAPRPVEALEDLRADATPWRSDEMMISIETAIRRYEQIVNAGGWPRLGGTRLLRPGDDDERLPALRRILRITGDLKAGSGGFEDYSYDGETEAAVRRFQVRHGLRANGRVDRLTIAALEVPAQARLEQLKLNHTRVAELMNMAIEDRYVLVNVPAFQLEAVERFEVERRHRVIVGRPERQTPSLKATIKAVNFFPFWRVPDSVAQLDLLPRLAKEPDYLSREQIRPVQGDFNGPEIDPTSLDWSQIDITKVKFRQDPGPKNALGLVRIDMQNEHGVYMHDTPLKELFGQTARPFSAGCVRVQDPFKLIEWLTRYEPGWENPGRVEETLASGQAVDLQLTRPVPVYFAYISAWAEKNGQVIFRSDVYNRDGREAPAEIFDPDAPPPAPQSLAP
ncbi:MAG: L,D-transpeptidase family protein [Hyphomicrobium sp.]